jgi:hypothetical protein
VRYPLEVTMELRSSGIQSIVPYSIAPSSYLTRQNGTVGGSPKLPSQKVGLLNRSSF